VFENIQAVFSACFLLFSRLSSLLDIIENMDKSIQASVVSGRLSKSLNNPIQFSKQESPLEGIAKDIRLPSES